MPSPQQLLDLSAPLDAVIEASPDAVIVLTPDHRIARFNAAAERQYGHRADDVLGRQIREYWGPEEWSRDVDVIDQVLRGEVAGPVVRAWTQNDGSTMWLSLTGVPVRERDGRVIATYWGSRDITAKYLHQREREERITRFTTAFEVSPIGMLVATFDGEHTMANPALCRMFGYTRREFLALNGSALHHPEETETIRTTIQSLRQGRAASEAIRRRRRHKDGHHVWVEETISVLERDPASTFQLLVQCRDVSAEVEHERRAQRLMDHDHLTGLLNRRAFERISTEHHQAAYDAKERGSLLVIDLDGFKSHNDTFGHAMGDRILVAVAAGLRRDLRDGDVAARIGGDEFAVLLRDREGAAADDVAGRLVDAIAAAVEEFRHGADPVTASIGVADVDHTATMADVAQRADRAMYRAKRQGRDRWSR